MMAILRRFWVGFADTGEAGEQKGADYSRSAPPTLHCNKMPCHLSHKAIHATGPARDLADKADQCDQLSWAGIDSIGWPDASCCGAAFCVAAGAVPTTTGTENARASVCEIVPSTQSDAEYCADRFVGIRRASARPRLWT